MRAEIALIEAVDRLKSHVEILSNSLVHMNYKSTDDLHVQHRDAFLSLLKETATISLASASVFEHLCHSHSLREE
jgi:hypothetical protein